MTIETVCCHGSNRISDTSLNIVGYVVKIDGKATYFNLDGHILTMDIARGPGGSVVALRILDGDMEAAPLPDDHPWHVTLDEDGNTVVLSQPATPSIARS
jgi:hypothetical protein